MSNFTKLMAQAAAGVGGGFYDYEINYSVHFEPLSSTYARLDRTIGSGSNTTWSWSMWVKPPVVVPSSGYANVGQLGVNGSTTDTAMRMGNSQNGAGGYVLWPYGYNNGYMGEDQTYAQFRDPSAWYHILWVVDTTEALETNRCKIYINGVQTPLYEFNSRSWPSNGNTGFGTSGNNMYITRYGYVAEVILLDGTATTPTSFGEFKNGAWVPIDPAAQSYSYGTNGFWLDFADSSNLGNDVSGNGNHFTASNMSSTNQKIDTPTNNFPTWSPLLKGISQTGASTYDGNMVGNITGASGNGYWPTFSTMTLPKNGKVYFEICLESVYNGAIVTGIMSKEDAEKYAAGTKSPTLGNLGYWSIHNGNAYAWGGDGQPDYLTLGLVPDAGISGGVVGFAIDLDSGKGWIRVNGTWILSGDPANGTNPIGSDIHTGNGASASGEYVIFSSGYISLNAYTRSILNCGQDSTFSGRKTAGNYSDQNGIGDFLYSVPSGFLALCTANLPEPTIGPNSATTSDENFDTILFNKSTAPASITGLEFQPDIVWTKNIANAYHSILFDAVRGASSGGIYPSGSEYEDYFAVNSDLVSFDTNGFTIGSTSSTNVQLGSNVGWTWKVNGSGSSNSDGSITSTVSANTDSGVSIVTYAGTSANATIGHGLGVAPKMVICKNRDVTTSWPVYHSGLSSAAYAMYFDITNAQGSFPTLWNSTAPTSSVFNVGTGGNQSNGGGYNYVAYCFAEVEGFSSFGSYTGNGSTDGPFIYTGFRPAFVIIRETGNTNNWMLFDDKRLGYNVDNKYMLIETPASEGAGGFIDILSNGFKCRNTQVTTNRSSGNYIYMAFAENPFKYANAR